jgi:sRNA-binding protein
MPHRKNSAEFRRGLQEAAAAITTLQERWPAAFPKKGHLVRPLVVKVHEPVAEAIGWSKPYALAVLRKWKFRTAYCQAVLAHDRRYDLDGAITEEAVGDEARTLARHQLAFKQEAAAKQRRSQAVSAGDARAASPPDAPAISPNSG